MTDVQSSVLKAVEYSRTSQSMTATFNSGAVYIYLDCPEYLYRKLLLASSKGTFLNQEVKQVCRCVKALDSTVESE